MTREEFIKELKEKRYSHKIEGDKIIVTPKASVYLKHLTSLPSGVEFKNGGNVYLHSLTSLPPGVEFKNKWGVHLEALTSIPPGFVFKNGGNVYLDALTSLPPGVVFNNKGMIDLESITGDWFDYWQGNIEGIASNRLLNKMIKQGVFQR
jgi:hypothetical protein